ncbi:MAG: HAD family hydrolase [Lachnospiraceae bacterium]|uniref:HAD family hydrolase n=1 Tax=Candidatus Weimeria bifida TaxID=2599074 RepID=A0A6N7J2E8_9FIRM|nr:HAD family hydrolase [Candidatus Weimeria bifida]RRF97399.1 MAG: HAD family hydrolase [Lachnospiraceae bacterium]
MGYKAAVFDMDGTILNTLGDLTASIDYALEKTGHEHDFTEKNVAYFFGSGVYVALKRALSVEQGFPYEKLDLIGTDKEPDDCFKDDDEIERISEIYRPYYDAHCADKTGPYPGILKLMDDLHSSGIKTAVVSNKPDTAVQTLVADMFPGAFDFSLGEKKGIKRKPAPDMVNECLRVLNIPREDCVYIGDSEVDFATGQNSDMHVISVDWGFRSHEYLERIPVEKIVSNAEELRKAIMENN